MKLGEVIQRVESDYSKGVPSKDSRLSTLLIYSTFATIRRQQLVRKLNKKQPITESNSQLIPCVELIDAPRHECNCLPNIACKIKKSTYQIPKVIGSLYGDYLTVMSVDGSVRFNPTTYTKSKDVTAGSKYAGSEPYYYIHNKHLYLINSKVKVVKLIGLFADVIEVYNFQQLCDTSIKCNSNYDVDFNMDDELFEDVITLTVEKVLKPFVSIGKQDVRSDERDDIIEQTK